MGGDLVKKLINAIEPRVPGWTEEKLAGIRTSRAEAQAAREKAATNPETKEEWENFVYRKGRKALSEEEVKEILKTKSSSSRIAAVIAKGGFVPLSQLK